MQLSRRAFFGAARLGQGSLMRPPWALPEAEFEALCLRCSACIDACTSDLLLKGAGGFPVADFTPGRAPQGCTFCEDCLSACQPKALRKIAGQAAWKLRAFIGEACLTEQKVLCDGCRDACEAGAIRFQPAIGGVAHPRLNEQLCTGCGACLADCPTQAIRIAAAPSHSNTARGQA